MPKRVQRINYVIMQEHVAASVSKTFQGHIHRVHVGFNFIIEKYCRAIHVHLNELPDTVTSWNKVFS